MVNENDKWIENIRLELDKLGLAFLWFTAYDEKNAENERCLYSGNENRNRCHGKM